MPPKKIITYPRYFQGTEDPYAIVVFPSEGSMGTVFYTNIKRWAHSPSWLLSEMNIAPEDVEILRWQAIALGVPSELPPFRTEERSKEL